MLNLLNDWILNATNVVLFAQTAPGPDGAPAAPSGPASEEPSLLVSLFPLILLFVIFYFMIIRPGQQQQKEQAGMQDSLKIGDKVIAAGGIHGMITNVKEKTVMLKVADNVKIEVSKQAVSTVLKSKESGEDETSDES